MSPTRRKWLLFGLTNLVLIGLDQASKIWIRGNIHSRKDSIDVIDGFFQIVHVTNRGAAFGSFGDVGDVNSRMVMFLGFTAVVLCLIAWQVHQMVEEDRFLTFIMGIITAGAVGNAIDRAVNQGVTDFMRFYVARGTDACAWLAARINTCEYPSWNVADACIVMGVILFLVHYLFFEDRKGEADLIGDGPAAAKSL
jgi:signal peptidase II